MFAERLQADVSETRLFQAYMAGRAAIHRSKFRQPDLLDITLEMALQGDGFAASPNHSEVLLLVTAPFAEVILGRSNCQRNQEQQADHAKGTKRVTEQHLPERPEFIFEWHVLLL